MYLNIIKVRVIFSGSGAAYPEHLQKVREVRLPGVQGSFRTDQTERANKDDGTNFSAYSLYV